VVICLKLGADLHIAQLMLPLALTVSCFSKIQIGFAYLVPAQPGSPGKRAVKRVCVCAMVMTYGHPKMKVKNQFESESGNKRTDGHDRLLYLACRRTRSIGNCVYLVT